MTKSYMLKIGGREDGPYTDAEVGQMFADGRVDRNAPCKPVDGTIWKSVDDHLPMLKYGTHLPPPSRLGNVPPKRPPALPLSQQVSVVDFDIPFWSVLKIMFKWMAAGFVVFCCFLPAIIILWMIVVAALAAIFGGAMLNLHH